MVELQPSKLITWVRFPSSAPVVIYSNLLVRFFNEKTDHGRKVVEKWSNTLIIFFILYIILLGDKNV